MELRKGIIVKSTAGAKPGGDDEKSEYKNMPLVIFQ
jgi:hypothetical protein